MVIHLYLLCTLKIQSSAHTNTISKTAPGGPRLKELPSAYWTSIGGKENECDDDASLKLEIKCQRHYTQLNITP